jgi:aminopeptidase N
VLRFGVDETRIGVLQMLQQTARTVLTHYVAPDGREAARARMAEGAGEALRGAPPGSDEQLAWVRFLAAVAGAEETQFLQGLMSGDEVVEGLEIDQELRWALLEPLTAAGAVGEVELDAELRRDDTAAGRLHQIRCLAARPSAAVKAEAWRSVVESADLTNAMVDAVIGGFNQPTQRELLAPYVEPYFEVITDVWSHRRMEIAVRVVSGLYPSLQASAATLARTDTWLERAPDTPALRRLVLEARDQLDRALRAQALDDAPRSTGP